MAGLLVSILRMAGECISNPEQQTTLQVRCGDPSVDGRIAEKIHAFSTWAAKHPGRRSQVRHSLYRVRALCCRQGR
jgi:hypothetical protein